jgi:hypothetical protein
MSTKINHPVVVAENSEMPVNNLSIPPLPETSKVRDHKLT